MDKAILAVVFQKEKKEAAGILSRAASSLSGKKADQSQSTFGRAKKAGAGLQIFEVQFNPTTLKYSTQSGRIGRENPPTPGRPEPDIQAAGQEDTTLSFELLIDGPDTRRTVNAMMGMLSSEQNRQVLFAWGTTCFPGKVEQMSAGYTMFDKSGMPVRGRVSMTIRQDAGSAQQLAYWEQALKKLTDR